MVVIGPDNRVRVVNTKGTDVRHGLDLLCPVSGVSVTSAIRRRERTYTSLTWSSVMVRPSCPTRLLTAFQPVRREPTWMKRVMPKSSGLMIS